MRKTTLIFAVANKIAKAGTHNSRLAENAHPHTQLHRGKKLFPRGYKSAVEFGPPIRQEIRLKVVHLILLLLRQLSHEAA